MITELKGSRKYYSIDNLCAVFGYTRQAWYNHYKRAEVGDIQQHLVLQKVQQIRTELPMTGCIKLHVMLHDGFLQSLGFNMGRDALYTLLRDNNLLIKSKNRCVHTTNSNHRFKIHPDLVQRRPASRAEQIWVSDITFLRTTDGFAFLSLITDAFSRRIVGYHLAKDPKTIGCLKALEMALKSRIYPDQPLIHHSDRGTQYCCKNYTSVLKQHKIDISTTQSGSPYDNAIAERVNGILKMEFALDSVFDSFYSAQESVKQAVYKYNNIRLHASCNFKTPVFTHNKNCTVSTDQKTIFQKCKQYPETNS